MFRKRIIIGILLWMCAALPSWAGRVDAVQGLYGTTLVAGKSTALRVYLNDQNANVDKAEVTITRPDTRRTKFIVTTNDTLRIVGAGAERSAAITIPGYMLPAVGRYFFTVTLSFMGTAVQTDVADNVDLLPTKDLRVGVDLSWSNEGIRTNEKEAADPAIRRVAQLLPVRDGVSGIDQDRTAGMRWAFQAAPRQGDPQMCEFFEPLATKPTFDRIDTAIGYRFIEALDKSVGGNSGRYCGSFRFGVVVTEKSSDDVAYGMAHEWGHIIGGLADGDDSNTRIGEEAWKRGYDIGNNDLWNQPSSAMYGFPGNFAYHVQHWETMRQGLLKYVSTGPSGPQWEWETLQAPVHKNVGVVAQANGIRHLFLLDEWGRMNTRKELAPATGLYGDLQWFGSPGVAFNGPIVTANEKDGRALVFARGNDGHVYYRQQTMVNGTAWSQWWKLTYAPVTGFTIAQDEDGALRAFLIENGSLQQQMQFSPGEFFQPPLSLGGWGLSGQVTAARNNQNRIEVFAIGGDGHVYSQLQTAANSDAFVGWFDLRHVDTPSVREISVARANDGRLALFMIKGTDRSLAVRYQSQPGSLDAPVQLQGSNLRYLRTATIGGGRLIAFVLNASSRLLTNFQIDANRPTVYSDFVENYVPTNVTYDFAISVLWHGGFDVYTINYNRETSQGRVRP